MRLDHFHKITDGGGKASHDFFPTSAFRVRFLCLFGTTLRGEKRRRAYGRDGFGDRFDLLPLIADRFAGYDDGGRDLEFGLGAVLGGHVMSVGFWKQVDDDPGSTNDRT